MSLGKLSRAKLPKEARVFAGNVRQFLKALDEAMSRPSSYERGRQVAALASALEYQVDCFEHFGISEPRKRAAK
jgi:hypothetical protein